MEGCLVCHRRHALSHWECCPPSPISHKSVSRNISVATGAASFAGLSGGPRSRTGCPDGFRDIFETLFQLTETSRRKCFCFVKLFNESSHGKFASRCCQSFAINFQCLGVFISFPNVYLYLLPVTFYLLSSTFTLYLQLSPSTFYLYLLPSIFYFLPLPYLLPSTCTFYLSPSTFNRIPTPREGGFLQLQPLVHKMHA